MSEKTAYRLATPERWAEVMMAGVFHGEAHDIADGFIHLSAAAQVEGTLVKHYNDHPRLLLAEIDLAALGDSVKWETSRGGELFPHVYGDIPVSAVRGVRHIRRNEEGDWLLPTDLGSWT
jgi:beta-hydroxylase